MNFSFLVRRAARFGGAVLAGALAATCADPVGTGTLPPAAVSVAPVTTSIAVGATARLVATGLDADGQVVTGVPVTWRSSDPSLAQVSDSGLVSGMAVGTATITAIIGTLPLPYWMPLQACPASARRYISTMRRRRWKRI